MPNKILRELPISVFIIACNEEDRVSSCISSVREWVDEVIVVDSGSADKTVKVSETLGAKIIKQNWLGYGLQKRFAEEQCRNKWVLNLDADEAISPELAEEIQKNFYPTLPSKHKAFKLKITSIYPHQKKPGLFPVVEKMMRLYHLDSAHFSESCVHESVQPKKSIESILLKGVVYHKSIRSLSHLVEKNNLYTDLRANTLVNEGKRVSFLRIIFEYPLSFLKGYFLKGNFLRGQYGVVLAYEYAHMRFMRSAKIWEKQRNQNV